MSTSKNNPENSHSFICKSGLSISRNSSEWTLLPIRGKGYKINLLWLYATDKIKEDDREIILDVLTFYARTKAASTTSGLNTAIKPYFQSGIITLTKLISLWSTLKVNQKKGLNQFFLTCKNLGHEKYKEYHEWTTKRLPKTSGNNTYSPKSGSLTDFEYKSFIKQINRNVTNSLSKQYLNLEDFTSKHLFAHLRNTISNKILLSIARRPMQLMQMKWCDIIPVGSSFSSLEIESKDISIVSDIGQNALQIRVFRAKESSSSLAFRFSSEKYSIFINESLSREIIDYKKICFHGLSLIAKSNNLLISTEKLLYLFESFPIFPDINFFNNKFTSSDEIFSLITSKSSFGHCNEQVLTRCIPEVKVNSDRTTKCHASNNRIRHTIITRGAQQGYNKPLLAKITGVTTNAIHHYVDMNFESRELIDSKYIGNQFLDKIFNKPTKTVGQYHITDHNFKPIGNLNDKSKCVGCKTLLAKPIGCYGCPNFIAIIEADHQSILELATIKLKVNKQQLSTPLNGGYLEKLQEQIEWIKYTIHICEQSLLSERGINDK